MMNTILAIFQCKSYVIIILKAGYNAKAGEETCEDTVGQHGLWIRN